MGRGRPASLLQQRPRGEEAGPAAAGAKAGSGEPAPTTARLSHEWEPELEPVKMKMSSEGSWVTRSSLDLSFPIQNRGRGTLARQSSGRGLVQLRPALSGQDLTKLRPLPGPRFPLPAQTLLSAEQLPGRISPGSRNSRASSLSLGSWWSGCHRVPCLSLGRSSEEALNKEGPQPEQGEVWRHACASCPPGQGCDGTHTHPCRRSGGGVPWACDPTADGTRRPGARSLGLCRPAPSSSTRRNKAERWDPQAA